MKLKYKPTILPIIALTCLTSLLPSTVKAEAEADQIKHPTKPFLWKVEGKDLTTPSYLFGTIHLSDPSVATLHPVAQKAFNQSDYFYAEIDMSIENQMAGAQKMMRKDGKQLNESIGAELTAQLDKELKLINPQLTSAPFQPMKTWLVAILPTLLPDQLAGKKPLDLQLWEAATKANKKTIGLETMEDQMKGFNSLTETEQITFLKLSLDHLEKERMSNISMKDKITKAYLQGDETKVVDLVFAYSKGLPEGKNKLLGQKIIALVLIARDKTISQSIINALKKTPKSSHFFAVGAAHYCTEKSILFHLKEAGYTVTRVEK